MKDAYFHCHRRARGQLGDRDTPVSAGPLKAPLSVAIALTTAQVGKNMKTTYWNMTSVGSTWANEVSGEGTVVNILRFGRLDVAQHSFSIALWFMSCLRDYGGRTLHATHSLELVCSTQERPSKWSDNIRRHPWLALTRLHAIRSPRLAALTVLFLPRHPPLDILPSWTLAFVDSNCGCRQYGLDCGVKHI